MSKIKDTLGKVDLSLLPSTFLRQVAEVRMHGDEKYGLLWEKNGRSARQMVAAMMRHCLAYLDREDMDPDSGKHHLAHVAAGVAVTLWEMENGTLVDDRAPGTLTQPPLAHDSKLLERLWKKYWDDPSDTNLNMYREACRACFDKTNEGV